MTTYITFKSWAQAHAFMQQWAMPLRAFKPVMRRVRAHGQAPVGGYEVDFSTPLPANLALRVMDWVA